MIESLLYWLSVLICGVALWMAASTGYFFIQARLIRIRERQEREVFHAIKAGHHYGADLLVDTGISSGALYVILTRLEMQEKICSAWHPETGRRYYWIPIEQVAPCPADRRFRKDRKHV